MNSVIFPKIHVNKSGLPQKEDSARMDNPDREKKLLDVLKSAQDERDRLDSKVGFILQLLLFCCMNAVNVALIMFYSVGKRILKLKLHFYWGGGARHTNRISSLFKLKKNVFFYI